jgi:hypothetical protein
MAGIEDGGRGRTDEFEIRVPIAVCPTLTTGWVECRIRLSIAFEWNALPNIIGIGTTKPPKKKGACTST